MTLLWDQWDTVLGAEVTSEGTKAKLSSRDSQSEGELLLHA